MNNSLNILINKIFKKKKKKLKKTKVNQLIKY